MNELFRTAVRVVTGRFGKQDVESFDARHLALGLLFAWLAGMGRYWDNPKAHLLQHLGLGSVVYVFALSLMIWLLGLPLRPSNWSYRRLVTFISLTAPLAFLYAIPVERFMSMKDARSANMWFLLVVAVWRVILYGVYLWRVTNLRLLSRCTMLLLPLALIVTALSILNLEHVVFNFMGGLQETDKSSADDAYAVVVLLTMFSSTLSPVLLIAYVASIARERQNPTLTCP